MLSIAIAGISMSNDNVLAVGAIARDDRVLLVFGLVLSIAFMGLIGGEMIWEGWLSAAGFFGIGLASIGQISPGPVPRA